jgi:hypothetical protein
MPSLGMSALGHDGSETSCLNDRRDSSVSLTLPASVPAPAKSSLEELIAFGGIPCPDALAIRSSARIGSQRTADMTQMERAMENAQRRDSFNEGTLQVPKLSIISIPDCEIVESAKRIGVSLGENYDTISSSIKSIKDREGERTLTMLQKTVEERVHTDEGPSSLVVSRVSNLCEDLVEDEEEHTGLNDQLDISVPVQMVKRIRKKKVYDYSNVRRSTRKKIKKQYS